MFGANLNVPSKPSKFQRTATAKVPKTHKRSIEDPEINSSSYIRESNKLKRMYSPQNPKKKALQEAIQFGDAGSQLNDSMQGEDSVASGRHL